MAKATVYLLGGGAIEIVLDAPDLADVAERLRRDRTLTGPLCATDAEDARGSEVLIAASRVQMVRWS